MLQRLMIQDFFLDKGRLTDYRIGEYDDAAANGYYTAANFHGAAYAPVADEVWNFDKFTLGSANPSLNLDDRALHGMWTQFNLIAAVSLPSKVSIASADYQTWLDNAVQNLTLAPPGLVSGALAITNQQVLSALVATESSIHSFALSSPLTFSSVSVGEQPSADRSHYYTDDGIGFCQVQPYNSNGLNLYDPQSNLTRGAQLFALYVGDPNNPGVTAPEKVWWAYFHYNSGHYSMRTIAELRDARNFSAQRTDVMCTNLGLPEVT